MEHNGHAADQAGQVLRSQGSYGVPHVACSEGGAIHVDGGEGTVLTTGAVPAERNNPDPGAGGE